jgi:hypothetical protein
VLKCGWCITKHHESCRIKINTGQAIRICECECKAEAKAEAIAEAKPEAIPEAIPEAEAQAEARPIKRKK